MPILDTRQPTRSARFFDALCTRLYPRMLKLRREKNTSPALRIDQLEPRLLFSGSLSTPDSFDEPVIVVTSDGRDAQGGAADDALTNLAGDGTLRGGDGEDVLAVLHETHDHNQTVKVRGGGGDDTIFVHQATVRLWGGEGYDTAYVTAGRIAEIKGLEELWIRDSIDDAWRSADPQTVDTTTVGGMSFFLSGFSGSASSDPGSSFTPQATQNNPNTLFAGNTASLSSGGGGVTIMAMTGGPVTYATSPTLTEPGGSWLSGNLEDTDNEVDALDADELIAEVRLATTDPALMSPDPSYAFDATYDLFPDGVINKLDLDHLVYGLLQTEYADGNLDGEINGSDYTFWANRFGSTDGNWSSGDYNLDGITNGSDYTFWANRFGFDATDPITVDASTATGSQIIYGRQGDDTLTGGPFDDFIWGGAGADTLAGNSGVDLLSDQDAASPIQVEGLASADEGSTYTLSINSLRQSSQSIEAATLDWGDGQVDLITGTDLDTLISTQAGEITLQHTYLDDAASFTAAASAYSGSTSTDSNTLAVNVNNVTPTVVATGPSAAAVGETVTIALSYDDPGADLPSQWVVNWGDGTSDTLLGETLEATHTYAAADSYSIIATATDDDGSYPTSTVSVTVNQLSSVTWDGGGDGVSWSDSSNWSGDQLPTAADEVIFNAGGPTTIVLPSNATQEAYRVIFNDATSLETSGTEAAFLRVQERIDFFDELHLEKIGLIDAEVNSAGPYAMEIGQNVGFGQPTLPSILDGVTLNTDISVVDDGRIIFRNGVELNGSVQRSSANTTAGSYRFEGVQTIAGIGEIILVDGLDEFVIAKGGDGTDGHLTIDDSVAVRGLGVINSDTSNPAGSLTNRGVIEVDVGGTVLALSITVEFNNQGTVRARDGSLEINPTNGTWTNSGLLEIIDGDLILGGSFTHTGEFASDDAGAGTFLLTGTLDATGSNIVLAGPQSVLRVEGGTIIGGVIDGFDGGSVRVVGMPTFDGIADATLDGVVLNADIDVEPRQTLLVRNNVELNGIASVKGGFQSPAEIRFADSQTITGLGELYLQSPESSLILDTTDPLQPSTLTVLQDMTVSGRGSILNAPGNTAGKLHNFGTILATDGDSGDTTSIETRLENDGVITAATGTLSIDTGGVTWINRGRLIARHGSTIDTTNAPADNLGVTQVIGAGQINQSGQSLNIGVAATANPGELAVTLPTAYADPTTTDHFVTLASPLQPQGFGETTITLATGDTVTVNGVQLGENYTAHARVTSPNGGEIVFSPIPIDNPDQDATYDVAFPAELGGLTNQQIANDEAEAVRDAVNAASLPGGLTLDDPTSIPEPDADGNYRLLVVGFQVTGGNSGTWVGWSSDLAEQFPPSFFGTYGITNEYVFESRLAQAGSPIPGLTPEEQSRVDEFAHIFATLDGIADGKVPDANVQVEIIGILHGRLMDLGLSHQESADLLEGFIESASQQVNEQLDEALLRNQWYSRTERLQASAEILTNAILDSDRRGWTDSERFVGLEFDLARTAASTANAALFGTALLSGGLALGATSLPARTAQITKFIRGYEAFEIGVNIGSAGYDFSQGNFSSAGWNTLAAGTGGISFLPRGTANLVPNVIKKQAQAAAAYAAVRMRQSGEAVRIMTDSGSEWVSNLLKRNSAVTDSTIDAAVDSRAISLNVWRGATFADRKTQLVQSGQAAYTSAIQRVFAATGRAIDANRVANSFASQDEIAEYILTEPRLVYRYVPKGAPRGADGGRYFATDFYTPEEARRFLALPDENLATEIQFVELSAGTRLFFGRVRDQSNNLVDFHSDATGGSFQLFVPDISNVVDRGVRDN